MKLVFHLILKIVRWWLWEIPTKFSVLALAAYCGLFFLFFGTMSIPKVESVLESIDLPKKLWMLLGTPMFLSFVSMFVGIKGSKDVGSLERVIQFRNGQMNISSDKKASEIFQKTSVLDAMETNTDSETYQKAKRGFEAKFGCSSPSRVLKELLDE